MGRLSKIAMCVALGIFAALVAYDNIVDYGTNYAFVQHVLSMDTVRPGSGITDRAIVSPACWRLAYALIIVAEGLTALLFLGAGIALWQARHAPPSVFQAAKRWVHAAASAGFVVWFFGFFVIGGEWFAMWRSPVWNGQEAAFRIIIIILAVVIYVDQPDGSTEARHRPFD